VKRTHNNNKTTTMQQPTDNNKMDQKEIKVSPKPVTVAPQTRPKSVPSITGVPAPQPPKQKPPPLPQQQQQAKPAPPTATRFQFQGIIFCVITVVKSWTVFSTVKLFLTLLPLKIARHFFVIDLHQDLSLSLAISKFLLHQQGINFTNGLLLRLL
jgi:hypothetical protein